MTSDATWDPAHLIEALDRGDDLKDVLSALIREIEAHAQNTSMLGSILLLDGDHLRHGAAPRLPAAYNAAIDGVTIGPSVGSCGTAAYCGHAIYVADIAKDPLWKDFSALALHHGLRACWSMPITSAAGRVLGTFALYYREPRTPSEQDRALIRLAADTARVLLEVNERRARGATGAQVGSPREA